MTISSMFLIISRSLRPILVMGILSITSASLVSCGLSNAFKGGGIGAASGGVLGGIIGNQFGSTATGAIIGAAVGGTAGALIGNYMDKQAAEMQRDLQNAKIERIGEGIKITFDSGILFESGSADLASQSKSNITELAKILNKYPDTNIIVAGFTDGVGSEASNQTLSEQRAIAVTNYGIQSGVNGSRFSTIGYGENQPIASNTTEAGKRQNRRVEIAILANDKLKDAAKKNML